VERRVHFCNHDREHEHELPDPRFLRLHAAICRVAHLSGAAQRMGEMEREREETRVLKRDGSSAESLSNRLAELELVSTATTRFPELVQEQVERP
jgi:hypothetical protein